MALGEMDNSMLLAVKSCLGIIAVLQKFFFTKLTNLCKNLYGFISAYRAVKILQNPEVSWPIL